MRPRSLLLAASACLASLTLTVGSAIADPTPTPAPTAASSSDGAAVAGSAGGSTASPPTVAASVPGPYFSVFPLKNKEETSIGSLLSFVTAGPDNAVWCTEFVGDALCRVNPNGSVQEFPLNTPAGTGNPSAGAGPQVIVTGPDGNLWFTNQFTSYLSRFTPRIHVLTTIPIPATAGAIADGPDGNLWFTAGSSVYRMRPTAPYTLTSYPVTQGSGVGQLTTGPDGNLWVLIENDGHGGSYIARLTPATGKFTYFDYHPDTAQSYSGIASITAGPDHSLWIAGGGVNTIITLKTTGSDTAIQNSLHDFDLPTPHSIPAGITQDAHGNIWFTEKGITRAVATITPSGHITEFPLPAANCPQSDFFGLPGRACQPSGITLGPDGKLWIAENGADAMVRMDTQINIVTGDVKNVNVKAGETTLIDEANVSGDITATGSSGVFVCSSIVHGNVNIDSSTGVGFIGSVPDNWVNCQGGQITGSVSVTNNQAGFAVGQYTIGGNVTVSNNYDGRVTSAASSADPMLRIEGNIIGGNLNCTNNAPEPPANEGIANTAHGSKNGQCSGL